MTKIDPVDFSDESILRQENERLRGLVSKFELAASTDPLTGLINRRGFDAAFERVTKREGRSGRALSIIVIDVDDFKHVNDTHGHAVGDEVLRGLGIIFRRIARGTDAPARIGGEEFAVLVEGPVREAKTLAHRMRWAVKSFKWPVLPPRPQAVTDDSPTFVRNVSVTVSCGVAQHLPGETLEQTTERADVALYRAKTVGRDRVVIAA